MHADDLSRFKSAGTEEEIRAGTVLIERGHPGAGVYVILEGTATVEAPERARELGPGSWVGERSMFSRAGLRTARVQAKSDLRVVAVARPAFERLTAEDPTLAARLRAATA